MASKLRGKKPKADAGRLKFLLTAEAGIGKTTAAIKMPAPYVIDTENGASPYADIIEASGGVVFESCDMAEVIEEITTLARGGHGYKTVVLDSFTPLYDAELDVAEKKVGSEFGRHYGEANKQCKRLFRLLSMLDMHVVVTAHAKNEYGEGMKVIGQTHDGWKKLPYIFDLSLFLSREGKKRYAKVVKSRFPTTFEDQSRFEWSVEELAKRCGPRWDEAAQPVQLASPEQVARLTVLFAELSIDAETIGKILTKAGAESLPELTEEQIATAITFYQNKARALVSADTEEIG